MGTACAKAPGWEACGPLKGNKEPTAVGQDEQGVLGSKVWGRAGRPNKALGVPPEQAAAGKLPQKWPDPSGLNKGIPVVP